MRKDFEMTESDLAALLDACKPTRVMFLSGGTPMCASPQENANAAWNRLGAKMGFKAITVKAIPDKGQRYFSAETVED